MNAKKCDRCGSFYIEVCANPMQENLNALGKALERTTKWETFCLFERMKGHADLCVECEKSLRKWCGGEDEC